MALSRLIDLELLIRLADSFEFVQSTETLVNFYVGDGISTDARALVDARRYLIKKYRTRLGKRRHYLASQYLFLASALLDVDENAQGLAMGLRAGRDPRIFEFILKWGNA